MARKANRLSARSVTSIKAPGRHADGGNLYLSITESGARSWVFMYVVRGRQREMGLGPARDVPLAEAREIAAQHRRSIRAGVDPLEARRVDAAKPTFSEFAEAHIGSMEQAWGNPKHRSQWRNTISTYAAGLAKLPVDGVTTADVLSVLKPIWSTKFETASRLRGRIESVLDAAKAAGHRTGENPAAWAGHLDQLLPSRGKLGARKHHKAMAIDDVPSFAIQLRTVGDIPARALEFTILTAARSGEVLYARWSEIDIKRCLWTVPPERMKGRREHRVPLSRPALEIIEGMAAIRTSVFVFPGSRLNKPLGGMAMPTVVSRMAAGVTVHGFRSTFKDWASERTPFPNELSEMALAHAIGDKTEAAYRRGDLFEKRRALMDAWASFLTSTDTSSNVVTLPNREHG